MSYKLVYDGSQVVMLLQSFRAGVGVLKGPTIGRMVRDSAELIRQQAVTNVGGYPVTYEGRTFRVMVRTGALRGSIETEWPYQGSFWMARVFVNGTHTAPASAPGMFQRGKPVSQYAAAIEYGHDAIDLKLHMMGKTVPFFASRGSSSRGPYAVRGLDPLDSNNTGTGSAWQNESFNARLQAKGKGPMIFTKKGGKTAYASKGAGTYFIAFRKVGKTGWIIPAAQPRPFMAAAGERHKKHIAKVFENGVNAALKEQMGS